LSALLRACTLAAVLVTAPASVAQAQLFVGSRPNPQLTVGPLFVTATVTPKLDVTVDVLWSLSVPPDRSAAQLEQTIALLWPGEIVPDPAAGKADPAVNRYVEERGFTVIEDGRIALLARSAYQLESDAPPERIAGGAAFVTFVRQGGALGLTAPATYIRMPWHPKMTNRAWLMNLRFATRGLVKPKPATWLESTFWGDRYRLELGFNDVRSRALFPLYFENRDRVLRLADDPSQLVMLFPEADRLKVDDIAPATAARRRHESLERTEVVSRFLDTGEGIVPQTLTVQFGYFAGLQWWAPILIPALFFVLGNALRPGIAALAARLGRLFASRLHFGPTSADSVPRQTGTVLSRDQLARLVPGETTRAQVLAVCGSGAEEIEQLDAPDRRALIYRGRRVIPRHRRRFGWVSTVAAWDVEEHEVEIVLERDVVQNVQARVRRTPRRDPPSTEDPVSTSIR
jgi:hypothetical protein